MVLIRAENRQAAAEERGLLEGLLGEAITARFQQCAREPPAALTACRRTERIPPGSVTYLGAALPELNNMHP